jgi:two-component system, sensor histidine kinase
MGGAHGTFFRIVEQSLQAKIIHQNGCIVYANRASATMFGYESASEFIADAQVRPLISLNDQPPSKPQHRESVCSRSDGTQFRVVIAELAIDWNNEPATQMAINDVEAHEALKEELAEAKERYDLAVRGSEVGIWDQDRRTGRWYWSARMRQILGVEPGIDIDFKAHFAKIIHPDDLPAVRHACRKAFEDRSIYNATFRILGPAKRIRWVAASGRAIQDRSGTVLRFAGSARDVTAQQEREASFLSAQTQAQAALAAKSRFLANISHELLTPLNTLITVPNLLGQMLEGDAAKDLVGMAEANGRHLQRLIQNMLDLSRVETDAFEIATLPFPLAETVLICAEQSSRCAQAKGIKLTLEMDPKSQAKFIGDVGLFRSVVGELLNNAVRFTKQGEIRVRLSVGDTGHGALLEVEDSGPGISPQLVKSIFEPFSQLDDSLTREHAGSGLGLGLARKVARAMGGELVVSSTVGRGSVFRFYVPIERVASIPMESMSKETETMESETPLMILVAEDNPANQKVISVILQQMGNIAVIAENGQACVDAFRTADFDLVLMDLHMPIMDGYAAARAIRTLEAQSGAAPTPIIALTADSREEAKHQAYQSGMNGYLTKPISIPSLMNELLRLMSEDDTTQTLRAVGEG